MLVINISILVGTLSLLLGILLLIAPDTLRKLNDYSTKMLEQFDALTFSYRIGFGVSLLFVAAFMYFMAYYFARRF